MSNIPFKILSIDGGGTRGLIPLLILEKIEELTEKRIHQLFDLIIGTSTGGIITCGLTVSDDNTNPIHSIAKLKSLYETKSIDIFPNRNAFRKANSLRRPLYNSTGIDELLLEYFKEYTIADCLTPIMIPTYNIIENRPLIFKSRVGNHGSSDFSYRKNPRLYDVCKATSAAPYYFPSHTFNYTDSEGKLLKEITCIDGGVYINNPALAALTEIKMHRTDPIYNRPGLKDSEIFLLSLGTGEYNKDLTNEKTDKWGIWKWARPLLDTMMGGTSKIIDYQTERLIRVNPFLNNYLRAEIFIENRDFKGLDNSSDESFKYFKDEVNRQLFNNPSFMKSLNGFIVDSKMESI